MLYGDRAGSPVAESRKRCCNSDTSGSVRGWILIGGIAVRTPNLPLAATVARRVLPLLAGDGHCRVGPMRLRWMRLQQFYRYIGAVP